MNLFFGGSFYSGGFFGIIISRHLTLLGLSTIIKTLKIESVIDLRQI